ncbi:F0F1 ATP synthase subunit epsilon [Oceanidesulfovibrio marinus]|uniref:ATP synthase epsilon chain n=1 Tax=Oceanidesulfovibrio marinus TaxID=370038 RepID=A0A6P1ZNR2_9BACT|nr:F0F1 ATP synthase subunit epsilon [Oceanidesulfovibrio marinus]QJT09935.1 F0F1 ATP synthase subunit epsilon [Oceanidesulfovibrio marinus]TVM35948.1 F0F1 ATP synthase subunit epsilon [Oceanidesulfovibrio marinus]
MEKSLQLEIVTPDKLVLSESVDYVGAPGQLGEFGVLPNHIPFLSALSVGNLYYKKDGKTKYVFVAGGFADVSSNKITILAEAAEKAEDIDVERARKAKERAEARLAKAADQIAYARAQVALQRALSRMKAAGVS